MIKFLPLDFLSVSRRVPLKNENAVYRLQISALVPEIFKFEKWVKYANEMTDEIIHSTQYYMHVMRVTHHRNSEIQNEHDLIVTVGRTSNFAQTFQWPRIA